MPVWLALTGTMGLNYARHRLGKSTLCSSARAPFHVDRREGQVVFLASWAALSGWLLPHFLRGQAGLLKTDVS
ncbi:MAG TPA: hypothetical protein VFK41_02185 [Nocardioidaceae bacterium]|nr:hypothetical protein [Nocardioidaceae bacterium]